MVWFVEPRKLVYTEVWHLCAQSDEGGGFRVGCDHDHKTAEEAQSCVEAQVLIGRVTGFAYQPPAETP